MNVRKCEIVLRRDPHRFLTKEAAALCAGIHPSLIERFIECDLIEPVRTGSMGEFLFDVAVIPRLKRIKRLRRDLGINVAGVAVILDMLERLEALRQENNVLRGMPEESETGG